MSPGADISLLVVTLLAELLCVAINLRESDVL